MPKIKCYNGIGMASRDLGSTAIENRAVARAMVAYSENEARGIMLGVLEENYPRKDGWRYSEIAAGEITDRDFLETAADVFVSMFNCNAQEKADA